MHTAQIEKLDADAIIAHVKERQAAVDEKYQGRTDDDGKAERAAKLKYEKGRFTGGAWAVTCECGWAANNPLASREDAEAARDEHYSAVRRELASIGGPVGLGGGEA